MSTSATRLLPPLVGAQYTRLDPCPHSSAAACQPYICRTPLSANACDAPEPREGPEP